MRVLVVGNSHVRNFLGTTGEADVVHKQTVKWIELVISQCGSTGATVWSLDDDQSETQAGRKIRELCDRERPDLVTIVLGDVDLRCHVWKNIEKNEDVRAPIERMLRRYEDYVTRNVLPRARWVCLVGCPPFSADVFDGMCSSDRDAAMVQYAIGYFNRKLRAMCDDNGWGFISFYDRLVDQHGYLLPEFDGGSDRIHMDHGLVRPLAIAALMNMIKKNGWDR